MDLQTIINHLSDEMSVEEREGQLTGTRPKTMIVSWFLPLCRENSALWRI